MLFLLVLGVILGVGAVAVFSSNIALSVGMAFLAVLMGIICMVASDRPKGGTLGGYRSEYDCYRSRYYGQRRK